MNTRPRRPYEKKQMSKKSALIFGLSLAAMLLLAGMLVFVAGSGISQRLENLPYYARTYYRKLVPHPEYLPTPAPTAAVASSGLPAEGPPVAVDMPANVAEITPAEIEPQTAAVAIEPTATAAAVASEPTDPVEAADSEPTVTEAAPPASQAADTLTNLPTPAVELASRRENVQLAGFTHQWQTWNNCGPATVTMGMSYFGRPETQVDAAKFLKPNKDDKNVNPHELAAYARTSGLEAIVRQGGSLDQLKLFLSNDIPVIAETWLVHDGDGLGHYRLVTGYDDNAGRLNTFDSLNGPDFKVDYAQFDSDWRVFNRLYVVVYPSAKADIVSGIIGADMDNTTLYERLAGAAQAEIEANPSDAIAHFNRGDALTRLQRYEEAAAAFDRARQIGLHWRRLWYQFTPFEAYFALERYQDVLDLAQATIAGTGGLEEAYYYQGLALQATNQSGPAEAFEAAIAYNPNFTPAVEALERLNNN